MSVTVIQGEQRGDEGKGRFVDLYAAEYDIVARFNGGNNAGHTVVTPDGRELSLHSIPSGIAYEHTMNIIGRGCLVNAVAIRDEIKTINRQGFPVSRNNLRISSSAHLILPHHISMDEIRETSPDRQGSTKTGIAPVAADKYSRQGTRAEIIKNDLKGLHEIVLGGLSAQIEARKQVGLPDIDIKKTADEYIINAIKLKAYITDTDLYLNERLKGSKPAKVLAEGAQAFWLDIDHGMYPYVSSSSTTVGGVTNGLGIPPKFINQIVGVSKLTPSHVGGGPFVTEIHDKELLNRLHGDKSAIDAETGTTTGRERRLGHLDLPSIRRAQMVSGTTEMAVTKLDWLPRYGETVLICISYNRKGKEIYTAPDAAYKLEQCTPNYVEMPLWRNQDMQGVKDFRDLPVEAQNYINFIEDELSQKITMIGTGPGREQYIDRREKASA